MPNKKVLGISSNDGKIKLFDLNPLLKGNKPVEIYFHQTEH